MSTITAGTPADSVRQTQMRPVNSSASRQQALIQPLIDQVFSADREYRHFGKVLTSDGLHNFIFAAEDETHEPVAAFRSLRWGGQFIYVSTHKARVKRALEAFVASGGFIIEQSPTYYRKPLRFLPWLGRRVHYFIARKVQLILPGEFTDRFTYNVELARHEKPEDEAYVVCKRVPSFESVVARLRNKWPDAAQDVIEKRAKKFTDKIFPTFLTREAAILMILQEHLPSRYAGRVPRIISLEKDIRGFVTTLRMNWLRNGGRPLSQLEFALQAADLLRAVHDAAGVIHLDLRLDNMVITEQGVGFVDFGSAVRVGEDLSSNPLLGTLFDELMRTSHIQKMLFHMTQSGQVTSQHLCTKHGKVDKAIDVFYLSLQFNTPHGNPDLAGLIDYDQTGEMAKMIHELSSTVLRPDNPTDTAHKSAKDILRSLELIEEKMRPQKVKALGK